MAENFDRLASYRDSAKWAQTCRQKAEWTRLANIQYRDAVDCYRKGQYKAARGKFQAAKGFFNANAQADVCNDAIQRKKEKQKGRNVRLMKEAAPILCLTISVLLFYMLIFAMTDAGNKEWWDLELASFGMQAVVLLLAIVGIVMLLRGREKALWMLIICLGEIMLYAFCDSGLEDWLSTQYPELNPQMITYGAMSWILIFVCCIIASLYWLIVVTKNNIKVRRYVSKGMAEIPALLKDVEPVYSNDTNVTDPVDIA